MSRGHYGLEYLRGESGTLWPRVSAGLVGDTMAWSICGVSRGHYILEYLRGESGTLWPRVSAGLVGDTMVWSICGGDCPRVLYPLENLRPARI